MDLLIIVLIVLMLPLQLLCIILMGRNFKLSQFLRQVNNEAYEACAFDRSVGRDGTWRQKIVSDAVDRYNDTMFRFWTPVESIIPDHELITNMHTTEESFHARQR